MPKASGVQVAVVDRPVEICRNHQGVPHIFAESDADLFFGFGYAVSQDRLFQLDWLRRKGAGRLSEILGPEGLPQNILARTIGLHRIAHAEWEELPPETKRLLASFSQGINASIEQLADALPIEFDLLDYRPEPWRPVDCLLIENEFRWYLTGRFPVIAMPELAKHIWETATCIARFLLRRPMTKAFWRRVRPGARSTNAGHGAPLRIQELVRPSAILMRRSAATTG